MPTLTTPAIKYRIIAASIDQFLAQRDQTSLDALASEIESLLDDNDRYANNAYDNGARDGFEEGARETAMAFGIRLGGVPMYVLHGAGAVFMASDILELTEMMRKATPAAKLEQPAVRP